MGWCDRVDRRKPNATEVRRREVPPAPKRCTKVTKASSIVTKGRQKLQTTRGASMQRTGRTRGTVRGSHTDTAKSTFWKDTAPTEYLRGNQLIVNFHTQN
mmetsp:Transcript_25864/g.33927  ORF Transcript_25864/g.33927 Transcript_25864/m.33927 type:complete len:100 (-) Transcript_25864:58-357(-)